MKNVKDCDYVFILDAGHGKDTKGKCSPSGLLKTQLFEWEYNRKIVKYLTQMLEENGIKFHVLVPEDNDVSLVDRVKRANELYNKGKVKCLYISIHGNAADNEKANGFEVFTSPGNSLSDMIASIIYSKAASSKLYKTMRKDESDGDPDKEADFYVLRKTSMPAILTENGFYTNKDECSLMLTDDFQAKVALYHYQTIVKIITNKLLG
jgi:N-acetylmuramoyl-L-alanine amidase